MANNRHSSEDSGWGWFDEAPPPEADRALDQAFARCFKGGDGETVLA